MSEEVLDPQPTRPDRPQRPLPDTGKRPNRGAAPPRVSAQSRGRPADPVVQAQDEAGNALTRRSRYEAATGTYEVPIEMREPGWDYQWENLRVAGQPVEASTTVTTYEAGWRPVQAKGHWMRMCPPGWDKPNVERDGMMLMKRPMSLTNEARNEDYNIALEQEGSKLSSAGLGPSKDPRMPNQVALDIDRQAGVSRGRT